MSYSQSNIDPQQEQPPRIAIEAALPQHYDDLSRSALYQYYVVSNALQPPPALPSGCIADKYLGQCLLSHLRQGFPEIRWTENWDDLTTEQITDSMRATLQQVTRSRIFVGTCAICEGWQKVVQDAPPLATGNVIEAYLAYKADGGATEGYLKVRARKLRFFARQYPELPTTSPPLRVYLRQFKTGDVPTRQDQWKALADLYKFAVKEYHIPNPMLEIDKPHFKKKPGKRLSHDQAKKFIAAINTDMEWGLVTCYFGLRLRRIEAERLLSEEIKSDYITVVDGKERGEELPLLPIFGGMLLKVENHGPNGRHFPIKADTMAYHIEQLGRRAGFKVTPHMLRNTAAALWYFYGGDKSSNRMLLRHSTDDMTDHYSNEFLDELRIKDERHNPMLNLMRELGLAPPYQNTTGGQVRNMPSSTPS